MSSGQPLPPAFFAALQAVANDGWVRFDAFMQVALFAPEIGYYAQKRNRVGRSADTDFYTATSSGPIFGELICAASATLLGPENNPRDFTFVEIGAETEAGILAGVAHPFGGHQVLRLGDALRLSGRCIVFSNELFDAQPCRSFILRENGWHERGVALATDGSLSWAERQTTLPVTAPMDSPVGYQLDLPLASATLTGQLAAQNWSGLFLACDYGKSWAELSEHTPQGTLRAYRRHRQNTDLLANIGQQDLTCHVCWDWLRDALTQNGFSRASVESQEAFFIKHAGAFIAQATAADAARFTARKMSILQLLHPANLGQKFQVLHAVR